MQTARVECAFMAQCYRVQSEPTQRFIVFNSARSNRGLQLLPLTVRLKADTTTIEAEGPPD